MVTLILSSAYQINGSCAIRHSIQLSRIILARKITSSTLSTTYREPSSQSIISNSVLYLRYAYSDGKPQSILLTSTKPPLKQTTKLIVTQISYDVVVDYASLRASYVGSLSALSAPAFLVSILILLLYPYFILLPITFTTYYFTYTSINKVSRYLQPYLPSFTP